MEQPTRILSKGTRVLTHEQLEANFGFGVPIRDEFCQVRRPGAYGNIVGVVGGLDGDIYYVQHENEPVPAVYCYTEFELASAPKRTRVYFDTEFTGLYQSTRLISIGCVTDNGDEFYAELADWRAGMRNVDAKTAEFIHTWVVPNLSVYKTHKFNTGVNHDTGPDGPTIWSYFGDSDGVAFELEKWLELLSSSPGSIEMWSDVLAYDWVLLRQLFCGELPKCLYYIPFDLATLFHFSGIDPDILREEFSDPGCGEVADKHNALFDARIIRACVRKLDELHRFAANDEVVAGGGGQ